MKQNSISPGHDLDALSHTLREMGRLQAANYLHNLRVENKDC